MPSWPEPICLGADLSQADLSMADLRANMKMANLQEADLRAADLTNANLMGANLENANLKGANLNCAIMARARLNGSIDVMGRRTVVAATTAKTAPAKSNKSWWQIWG